MGHMFIPGVKSAHRRGSQIHGAHYCFVATFNEIMHAVAVFGHFNNYIDSPLEPVIIPCFPRDTFLWPSRTMSNPNTRHKMHKTQGMGHRSGVRHTYIPTCSDTLPLPLN